MISPLDSVYKETKQIMLGNEQPKIEYKPLVEWIHKTYCVKPINVSYYVVGRRNSPILEVCFETDEEKNVFYTNNMNLDSVKQKEVGRKFKEIMIEQGIIDNIKSKYSTEASASKKYDIDKVWVVFDAFELIAKIEANQNIPQAMILELEKELSNGDIWKISTMFSMVTFFLFTDKQVEEYRNSNTHKEWTRRYLKLLKQYDEFNYFNEKNFSVLLDSKENFDNNYNSNWYFYYK